MVRCTTYTIESNRGKSFNFSIFDEVIKYSNTDIKQDFVSYNGSLYACIKSVSGINPEIETNHGQTVGEHWVMVVTGVPGEKGDRGESVIGPRGKDGESAYDVAKQNGFKGTINEWLKSLIGPIGPKGESGKDGESIRGPKGERGYSAYDIAVNNGFNGSEVDWIKSLIGKQGEPGKDGISIQGPRGYKGKDGQDGKKIVLIDGEEGLYWYYEDSPEDKQLLVKWCKLEGPEGRPAKQIVLDKDPETKSLVWKYAGEPNHKQRLLASFDDIKGNSVDGAWINDDGYLYISTSDSDIPFLAGYVKGDKGENGDRVVFRISTHDTLDPDEPEDHIHHFWLQWKYDGEDWRTWTDLINVNDLIVQGLQGIQFSYDGIVYAKKINDKWVEGEGTQHMKFVFSIHVKSEDMETIPNDEVKVYSITYIPLRRVVTNISFDENKNEFIFTIDDPSNGIITEKYQVRFKSSNGIIVNSDTSEIKLQLGNRNSDRLHLDRTGLWLDDLDRIYYRDISKIFHYTNNIPEYTILRTLQSAYNNDLTVPVGNFINFE